MKIAMVLIQQKITHKNGNKKLGSHCSNAVGNKKARGIVYSDTWVYNSDFHDDHLLNVKNVQKLILMCRFTKPNVLFSDVVKKTNQSKIQTHDSVTKKFLRCLALSLRVLLNGSQIFICWQRLSGASLNAYGIRINHHKIELDCASRLPVVIQ